MSLSMTAEAQGKWEYVPSKKQRDQGKKDRKVRVALSTEGKFES